MIAATEHEAGDTAVNTAVSPPTVEDASSVVAWPASEAAAWARVLVMQTKLHRWASADPGRVFDEVFNLVHDPAFLLAAWTRVHDNKGGRTAGVDGLVPRTVASRGGLDTIELLTEVGALVKSGRFRPLPVRARSIPKAGGKVRVLGIPTMVDRIVQASLKLVLEPSNYEWVFEADIAACFDEIDHGALMGKVRGRIADRRVLGLIRSFLRAGVLSEDGVRRDTWTGTPQGGILSPLLANIALSVLDEHFAAKWAALGPAWTRAKRRRAGVPTMRLVRYADDFVVVVYGSRADAEALWDEVADVLATMGLRLSESKTRLVHFDEGFDFLGWRIQRRRIRGHAGKRAIYTYPSRKSLTSVMDKVRSLTGRAQHRTLGDLLRRLNPVIRGWCAYFQHGVSKATFSYLDHFAFWPIVGWLKKRHPTLNMHTLVRRHLPGWRVAAGGIKFYRAWKVPITRYRYRGAKIPTPWTTATRDRVESRMLRNGHVRFGRRSVETSPP